MQKHFAIALAFILGVGAGWIIQGRHWNVFLTSYIPALATLVAAFYGAKFAFKFQQDKEKQETTQRNLLNANSALFSMSRMANKLFLYQRDVINPVRNSPGKFLELPPTQDLEKEFIEFETQSLVFLLETTYINLLGEVLIEVERYRTTIEAINTRSRLHIQTIQPRIEQANFPANKKISISEIENCLGDRLSTTLRQSTDQVIDHVDSSLESIKTIASKLQKAIKDLYPTAKVISFSLPETK